LPEIEAQALREASASRALEVLKMRLGDDPRPGARRLLLKFEKRAGREEKEKKRLQTLLRIEREAEGRGFRRVAGIDEAGRGPLAGPVVAAAVILPPDWFLPGVNDSKKVSPANREILSVRIGETALAVGVGEASAGEIDGLNIYRASQLAMERAVEKLGVRPDYLLTDAMPLPGLSALPQKPLVHGDALSASIAAASILAKVARDRMMSELHRRYPLYGFDSHKGYGTAEHLEALRKQGPCPEHRLSFTPVLEARVGATPGGAPAFWREQLESCRTPFELERTGQRIKRAAGGLSEGQLEILRGLFREKRRQWPGTEK
jgi:ribonuclease HII